MKAAEALRELSEPWSRGDRIKTAIDRVARQTGLSYWRAFDIWYGKARQIQHEEIKAIEAALERKRETEAKNELHTLKVRLARLEGLLLSADEDFHRVTIDLVEQHIRRSR